MILLQQLNHCCIYFLDKYMGFSNILRLNLKEGSDKVFDLIRTHIGLDARYRWLDDLKIDDLKTCCGLHQILLPHHENLDCSLNPNILKVVHGFWYMVIAEETSLQSVGVNYQTVNWSQLISTMPKVCVIKTDNTALDALSRSPHVILWYCKVHWWHAIASSIKHHLEPDCSLGRQSGALKNLQVTKASGWGNAAVEARLGRSVTLVVHQAH